MKSEKDLINVMKKCCPGQWATDEDLLKEFKEFQTAYTGKVKDRNGIVHDINSYYAFQVVKSQGAEVVTDGTSKKPKTTKKDSDKTDRKGIVDRIRKRPDDEGDGLHTD